LKEQKMKSRLIGPSLLVASASAFALAVAFTVSSVATTAAQANPCTAAPVTSLNPTTLFAQLPDQNVNEADGQPRVTDYQFAYFTSPVATVPILPAVTVAKSAFTLVAGTQDCYRAALPATLPTVLGTAVGGLKTHRAARTGLPEAESAFTISNPFGTAPSVLAAPGRVVISQ
jgi:hypothetical protein